MRRLRRKRKNKFLIIILLLILTMGYAVLQKNISVTGTTKISAISLNVYWDNLEVKTGSMMATTPAHIMSNPTTVEFSLKFYNFGQYYEFSVDAINESNMDVMIDSITTKLNGKDINSNLLEYKVSYSDGTPINIKDYLKIGADHKESILFRIKLKDTVNNNDLAELNNSNFTFNINYVQADDTAQEPEHEYKCTYDGELIQGAEFIDGPYIYKYMQDYYTYNNYSSWSDITDDGWGVALVDYNSTEPITQKLCKTINDKPIVSTNYLYSGSKATSIDVSSLDTSHVTSMISMFATTKVQSLDLSSFDTSNVTNMKTMFYESNVRSINLSSFDTSKVVDMQYMFDYCAVDRLVLTNFDTTSVTNMDYMFSYMNNITYLDISSFNTSNVTSMNQIFRRSPNLEVIYVGSGWTTSGITTQVPTFLDYTFENDAKLPNFSSSDITIAKAHTGSGGYLTLKT